jgi:gas vesicle protein
MNENKNNSLIPLVIGIIVGAAATYLYTNPKGEKVREKLLKEGGKLLEKISEGLEEVQEEVTKGAKKIEAKIEPVLEEAKEKVEETIREVPKQVQEAQKKGRHFFFSKKPKSPES